jgi:hypothetical protein
MKDDDRIAYLSGDDGGSPDPEETAELDELRRLLGRPELWAEPPADMEDRVAAAIAAERDGQSPQPQARPNRQRRWRARVVGIAAALLITVGIGVAVSLARRDHGGEHLALALAAPSGTTGIDGHVDFTRTTSGWRVELVADALPRRDAGRYYEAWMANGSGTLVPVGTFNEAHHVVLWSAVSPRDVPTLTVTEEEADNNQASSGRRVLIGTLGG